MLRADRLPAGCWSELAAAAGVRVWLLTAKMTPGQRAALEACATAGPAAHRPWRAALADLPAADGSRPGGSGFPAVPDAEFPLFRATAARLLDPAAFAQVDTVYRDTYARACGHNAALRHASGGDCAGAVLQQLTIDAASADEVLTRLRAAQAGLFAGGLLLDLRPVRHPPWELRTGCLRPRLDHATVARLRGLADPVVAAAVTLSRATGMTPAQLCALRRRDVIRDGAGLRVRAGRLTYRIPGRAAGPVRAAVLHQPPAPDGGPAGAAGPAPLLVTSGGAPISETALQRLRHHGAARVGVALPPLVPRLGDHRPVRPVPGPAMTRRPARRGRPARRLVINWALIEQRRIAAGMTHAQLAARAGPGAVTGPPRLWTDNDHDAVPLGLLERLCQVLDLHPAELFQPPARAAQRRALRPAGPPADETVLEAALATVTTPSGHPGTPIAPAALANALGWSLERLNTALAALTEPPGRNRDPHRHRPRPRRHAPAGATGPRPAPERWPARRAAPAPPRDRAAGRRGRPGALRGRASPRDPHRRRRPRPGHRRRPPAARDHPPPSPRRLPRAHR